MKLLRIRRPLRPEVSRGRRGVALLLSLLLLIVLAAIVFQIKYGTDIDNRVAHNDVHLSLMDQAAESALLEVYELLATDAEATGGAAAGGAEGAGGAAAAAAGGTPGGGGESSQPTDSRLDEWAQPQRTEINEYRMRILVQDEDSKLNVLTMLDPDEDRAKLAFERIQRCIDLCREGTTADIERNTAEEMARAMLEHMQRSQLAVEARPSLLSDDPNREELGLPHSLREFAVLPPFEDHHFREFRDENGVMVHSLEAFLTVWSSLATAADAPKSGASGANVAAGTGGAGGGSGSGSGSGSGGGGGSTGGKSGSGAGGSKAGGAQAASSAGSGGAGAGSGGGSGGGSTVGGSSGGGTGGAGSGGGTGGAGGAGTPGAGGLASAGNAAAGSSNAAQSGGYVVNVNTAPVAVLKALFDDRDVHPRFWDRVVEYRNLEEEPEEGAEDVEPQYDEYGEEIKIRRIFDSLAELAEVDGFRDLEAARQQEINALLSTQSHVFSVFVIARRSTSAQGDVPAVLDRRPLQGEEDEHGDALVRVVRSVVWRHKTGDEVAITPIVRWEVLDHVPYEVLDYAEEDR